MSQYFTVKGAINRLIELGVAGRKGGGITIQTLDRLCQRTGVKKLTQAGQGRTVYLAADDVKRLAEFARAGGGVSQTLDALEFDPATLVEKVNAPRERKQTGEKRKPKRSQAPQVA